jgi:glycosyltransferase involved in cell wall biosynthesis
MTTIAFVLVSWRPDVPAGMERAVAGHAAALTAAGDRAIIITADPAAPPMYRGVQVITLSALKGVFPCDDITLRAAIGDATDALRGELLSILQREPIEVVVYVDGLWGLGRIMPTHPTTRNVLAVHVVGHDVDLQAALARKPAAVIVPSSTVLVRASARGYDTAAWKVVANTLLTEPEPQPQRIRERVYARGPVRVLARLGPEKGVAALLEPRVNSDRPVEIALAEAPFQLDDDSQQRLRRQCRMMAADSPQVTIRAGLTWDEVPAWLGEASLVIVPSLTETFGLVALEALAASTPVIAYDIGNLPELVAGGGVLVPRQLGPDGLWRAARELLSNRVEYRRTSRAAYYRSRDYWPALVANQLLKVVS